MTSRMKAPLTVMVRDLKPGDVIRITRMNLDTKMTDTQDLTVTELRIVKASYRLNLSDGTKHYTNRFARFEVINRTPTEGEK